MSEHPKHPNRYVAAILAILQEQGGESVYAFSRKTGLSESTLRAWVKRGNGPSTATVRRICEALEISEEELLAKADSPPDVCAHKMRVSVQLGGDSVQNSQLILRAIKNLHRHQAEITAQLLDLTVAVEKAAQIEQEAENTPSDPPATTQTATAANGTR